jgi:hypothetical protein
MSWTVPRITVNTYGELSFDSNTISLSGGDGVSINSNGQITLIGITNNIDCSGTGKLGLTWSDGEFSCIDEDDSPAAYKWNLRVGGTTGYDGSTVKKGKFVRFNGNNGLQVSYASSTNGQAVTFSLMECNKDEILWVKDNNGTYDCKDIGIGTCGNTIFNNGSAEEYLDNYSRTTLCDNTYDIAGYDFRVNRDLSFTATAGWNRRLICVPTVGDRTAYNFSFSVDMGSAGNVTGIRLGNRAGVDHIWTTDVQGEVKNCYSGLVVPIEINVSSAGAITDVDVGLSYVVH